MGPRDRWGPSASTALVLAALLTFVPAAPAASASHTDPPEAEPWMEPCDDGRWMGFQGGYSLVDYRLCFYADAQTSSYVIEEIDRVQYPPDAHRVRCPDGFNGDIVEWRDHRVGLCIDVIYRHPESTWPRVGVDVSGCEVPGDQEGEDPAVFVADGGAAICVLPIVEVNRGPPDHQVSIEPCEPQTVDPEVTVAGYGAQVCLDVNVLGFGSDDVNEAIRTANATVNETQTFLANETGGNETGENETGENETEDDG
jgi:hypothetical protein